MVLVLYQVLTIIGMLGFLIQERRLVYHKKVIAKASELIKNLKLIAKDAHGIAKQAIMQRDHISTVRLPNNLPALPPPPKKRPKQYKKGEKH